MYPLQTIKLLEGNYSSAEAHELVIGMINYQINALNIRNLSSEIRFGKPDSEARELVEALKKERTRLIQVFKQSETNGSTIKVHSNIHINLEHGRK